MRGVKGGWERNREKAESKFDSQFRNEVKRRSLSLWRLADNVDKECLCVLSVLLISILKRSLVQKEGKKEEGKKMQRSNKSLHSRSEIYLQMLIGGGDVKR